ncbi:hypothetical protein [Desulfobacula sp.]|uniref:hypothetical protein n=1 Tax=Desulfobacula sp. TaxID=2593537 RepID=UPI00262CC043|nr:hypothetical protein [Desulfobacula sp.]
MSPQYTYKQLGSKQLVSFQVQQMIYQVNQGISKTEVARRFGISGQTLNNILTTPREKAA